MIHHNDILCNVIVTVSMMPLWQSKGCHYKLSYILCNVTVTFFQMPRWQTLQSNFDKVVTKMVKTLGHSLWHCCDVLCDVYWRHNDIFFDVIVMFFFTSQWCYLWHHLWRYCDVLFSVKVTLIIMSWWRYLWRHGHVLFEVFCHVMVAFSLTW